MRLKVEPLATATAKQGGQRRRLILPQGPDVGTLQTTGPLTTLVTLASTTHGTSAGAETMTPTPSDPTKCAAPASLLRSDARF